MPVDPHVALCLWPAASLGFVGITLSGGYSYFSHHHSLLTFQFNLAISKYENIQAGISMSA